MKATIYFSPVATDGRGQSVCRTLIANRVVKSIIRVVGNPLAGNRLLGDLNCASSMKPIRFQRFLGPYRPLQTCHPSAPANCIRHSIPFLPPRVPLKNFKSSGTLSLHSENEITFLLTFIRLVPLFRLSSRKPCILSIY